MKCSNVIRIFVLIYIVQFAGCIAHISESPKQLEPAFGMSLAEDHLLHTVTQKGETLALISKHYTGSTTNWRMLLGATPWLRDETIHLGQLILVPKPLLRTKKPLAKPRPNTKKVEKRHPPKVINIPLADAPMPPGLDPEEVFLRQRLYEELVAELNERREE